MTRLKDCLPRLGIVSILGAIYFSTMAPDFSWANGGVDGGDLITAAWTGGVAHPTGYPLYLILARMFQALPWGTLAFRTNVFSAVCLLLASLVLYDLIWQMSAVRRYLDRVGIACLGALAFGLSPLVWSQATITEVYPLHLLFVSLILHQALLPLRSKVAAAHPNLTRGLTFGLGLGNHVTLALFFPLLFFRPSDDANYGGEESSLKDLAANLMHPDGWIRVGVALASALALYLTLLVRGHSTAPVKWGNPTGLSGLIWLLTGGLYQGYLQNGASYFPLRLEAVPGVLLNQFGLLGIFLGSWGLVFLFRRSRYYAVTIWIAVISLLFSLFYASYDSYIYLLPFLLVFSLWLADGIGSLSEIIGKRWSWGRPLLYFCMFVFLSFQTFQNYPLLNASRDRTAIEFGQMILAQSPKQAILLTHADRDTFSLWYLHYALGERSDVAIVVEPFLSLGWYRETLQANDPWLVLPADANTYSTLETANPGHPVCNVYADRQPSISCP